MKAKHLTAAELQTWVNRLIQADCVYGAVARDDKFAFGRLHDAAELRLDYDVTILPPKKYFQPQTETILTFSGNSGYKSVLANETFVLFGVHPYDMAAIAQMDKVFTADDRCDIHYLARREGATIVVLDVQTPSKNVFAGGLGFATSEKARGDDVRLTLLDDGTYIAESRTAKGDRLMQPIAEADDAGPAALDQRRAIWTHNAASLRKHQLEMAPEDIPTLLEAGMNHPVWEEKAERCYSCGSCNLVCPTCYCFNVRDEFDWDMESGRRVREWDGCMLASFAAVAGGHNFRSSKTARYRHRYLRKGLYAPRRVTNEISCVGCGRCITACTAKIANPVDVFNRLLEAS